MKRWEICKIGDLCWKRKRWQLHAEPTGLLNQQIPHGNMNQVTSDTGGRTCVELGSQKHSLCGCWTVGVLWEQKRWACLFFCCLYKITYQEFKKKPCGAWRALLLSLRGKVCAGIPGRAGKLQEIRERLEEEGEHCLRVVPGLEGR